MYTDVIDFGIKVKVLFSGNDSELDIPGIDLSKYVRDPRSYNPILYIHKKLLPYAKNEIKIQDCKKVDKGIQFDHEKFQPKYKTKIINHNNDPVVEQTIKFAKEIIPITIPPSTDASTEPIYFIKSNKCQKRKKTDSKLHQKNNAACEKERSHNFTDEVNKTNQTFSGRESLSRSSHNNTIDDIQENRSFSCSLSEHSEKRNLKREKFLQKCKDNDVRMIASESFEALAENLNSSGDAKIKIHLMNGKDKSLLCESIRTPVIKAIRECILETQNTSEVNFELKNIQSTVKNNTHKLDIILEKINNIEKKLELLNDGVRMPKISKLEELEQDVILRDSTSEEELAQIHFNKKKKVKVITLSPKHEEVEIEDSVRKLDRGEFPSQFQSSSQLNVRSENPSRIPARFCWTDVGNQ
ncbi:unnamed protein product [Leptosia nina]|uniref:Uncharacterized protein n=1 Tax=Leptosia nina TaxID=320188 RepID=A0AAV1JPH9_9NEOP